MIALKVFLPIRKLIQCSKIYVLVQDSNETVYECDVNDDDDDDLECDESPLDVLLETMRAMDDGKIGTQFFMLAICGLGNTSCDENDDQHSDDALKEQNAENGMRLSSCFVE